ncbi:MAG: hypothetical protein JJV94_00730 [Sulfurospirillum sp.]|nr:hypothetical protein [Sulfurospirillum sp.]
MNRDKFDDDFSRFSLSEIIKNSVSNNKIKKLLQTFICNKNIDLQDFLHNKALVFEKNLRSRTYLYIDNNRKNVVAYFTIAINTLYTDDISSKVIKLLDGYRDDTKSIPCFLIGQLGKSNLYKDIKIGQFIIEDAIEIIDNSQISLGGRFILLDSINIKKVISFYENNLFFAIENDQELDSIKMIKPYFIEHYLTQC